MQLKIINPSFRDRIMVTLSSLIVLAALFSQMSSTLPDSPAPKAIEVFFFYYIARLSYVFACHTILWRLRCCLYTNVNEQKEFNNELIEYRPHLKSRIVHPMIPKADAMDSQDCPTKTKCMPLRVIDKVCLYFGLTMDFIFLGLFFLFVATERNKRLSVIDYSNN